MGIDPADRHHQLVRCAEAVASLASNRVIVAQHVSKLKHDHEIRRILDAVVRRWSDLVPSAFYTEASVEGRAAKRQRDHLVPRRVLVDRLIINPADAEAVLEAVVLVEVSGDEHRRLGHIYADHKDLYSLMLAAPLGELVELGWRRYERGKIQAIPIQF